MSKKIKIQLTIDPELCIACGVCHALVPEAYTYDEKTDKYTPTPEYKQGVFVSPKQLEQIKETIDSCPVGAIKLKILETAEDEPSNAPGNQD